MHLKNLSILSVITMYCKNCDDYKLSDALVYPIVCVLYM